RVECSGSISIGSHGQGDATVDELTQPWRLQRNLATVGFNKAVSVQCHFSIQSNSAAKLFDPNDVFRTNSLSVLDTPPQTIKRGRLVQIFQCVEEGRDVFVVADVHAERDSS